MLHKLFSGGFLQLPCKSSTGWPFFGRQWLLTSSKAQNSSIGQAPLSLSLSLSLSLEKVPATSLAKGHTQPLSAAAAELHLRPHSLFGLCGTLCPTEVRPPFQENTTCTVTDVRATRQLWGFQCHRLLHFKGIRGTPLLHRVGSTTHLLRYRHYSFPLRATAKAKPHRNQCPEPHRSYSPPLPEKKTNCTTTDAREK